MTVTPTRLATLLEWARSSTPQRLGGQAECVADLILRVHDSHAAKLRAEIVELAVTWRNATGQMATTIAEARCGRC